MKWPHRPPFAALLVLFLVAGIPTAQDPASGTPDAGAEGSIRERRVGFAGAQGLELQGSLALPAATPQEGSPALLLLPGSGPTDRDGNQPPFLKTNLLKQIAERLAEDGVASLRFDKRAARTYLMKILALDQEEQNEFLSWENFLNDAKAALRFLRAQKDVDPSRIGLLGHSEGGLIALQVAHDAAQGEDRPRVLVLVGTEGTPLADVIRYQIGRAIAPHPEEQQKEFLAQLDRAIEQVVESKTVPEDLPRGLRALFPANATRLLSVELERNPTLLAEAYPGPVLLLHGERDVQIPAAEHTALFAQAFAKREAGSCELFVVPEASHNLKRVENDSDPGFEGEVVPAALDRLVAWLRPALGG